MKLSREPKKGPRAGFGAEETFIRLKHNNNNNKVHKVMHCEYKYLAAQARKRHQTLKSLTKVSVFCIWVLAVLNVK